MLRNIKLIIEYDGEPFFGWQRQGDLPTIQGVLEDCLEKISGSPINLYGAGRTDSGVHARGQVANFSSDLNIPPERWALALNTRLPPEIRVLQSSEAPPEFHAQRSAKAKVYEYRVLNRNYSSALDRRVYFCPLPLKWDIIREALPYFVGRHDFKAFQSAGSERISTVREILAFDLEEEGNGVFRFRVEGSGFLKQMVRNMIGTVLEVGQTIRAPWTMPTLIASGDRELAGRAAPARGLCLVEVKY